VSGAVLLFLFTYGHIYNFIKALPTVGSSLARHRYLVLLFLVAIGLFIWWLIKKPRDEANLVLICNLVTLFLVLYQVIQIGYYEIRSRVIQGGNPSQSESQLAEQKNPPETIALGSDLPDIYLIVLDRYSRSDWLKEWSDYDNSAFIESLREMGFYVADCSRSNYSYTLQSMTSELNMAYLNTLFDQMDNVLLKQRLMENEVARLLTGMGYEFIAFKTGYPAIEMKQADHFYAPEDIVNMTNFEVLYLDTTLAAVPLDFYKRSIREGETQLTFEETKLKEHANQVNAVFDYLENPPDYDAPVFVYAHVVSPHPPSLFREDGSINYDWESDPDANDKTYQYVNQRALEVLPNVIGHSDPAPIIILQADHGNGDMGYANLILNAYYLPDGGVEDLYPTITPVNSFRLIFSHYFGLDYPLLDDVAYYSFRDDRYRFFPVDDPMPACQDQ
jgi:hypothetical protein